MWPSESYERATFVSLDKVEHVKSGWWSRYQIGRSLWAASFVGLITEMVLYWRRMVLRAFKTPEMCCE